MYVDVWSYIARHEREINSIQKLWKLRLIPRSTDLALIIACYKVTNTVLKWLLKAKVKLNAFLSGHI